MTSCNAPLSLFLALIVGVDGTAFPREPTPVAAALAKGDSLRAADDLDAAISAYSEAIRLNPKSDRAYLSRGSARAGMRQWADAIADYSHAIRLADEDRPAYLARARAFHEQGRRKEAILDYSVAIGLDPQEPSAYLERAVAWPDAKLARASADCNAAIVIYTQDIRTAPKSCHPYIDRGCAYATRQDRMCGNADWLRAVADFTDAILWAKTNTDKSRARFLCGCAYRDLGSHDDAQREYNLAILLDPTNTQAYLARGDLYVSTKEWDKGVADFTQVIGLKPRNAEAYVRRGRVYAKTGRGQEAIADFSSAIRLLPNCAEAHFSRAWQRMRDGDHERAVADSSQAICSQGEHVLFGPTLSQCYHARGRAHAAGGNVEQAIADLSSAIRLFSGHPDDLARLYFGRGKAYERIGASGDANDDIARATKRGVISDSLEWTYFRVPNTDYGRLTVRFGM